MNVGTHHVGNSRLAGEFLSRPLALVDRYRNGAAITRAAFEQHRGKEGEAARYFGPKKKHRRRRHPAHPRNGLTASRSWLRWLTAVLVATFVGQVGEAFEQNSGRVCQIAGYQGESCRPGLSRSVRIRDKDQTYDNSYAAVREAPLGIVAGDEFYGWKSGEGSRRIYRGSGRQHRERSLFPAPTTTRPGPATTTVATVPVAKQVQGRWTSSLRPGAGRSITITGKLNNQSNNYLLTWGISTGNVTRYELRRWKAPLGSRGESAYRLDATIPISAFRTYRVEIGMSHGRYMYRVAACNNNGCGNLGPRNEVLVYPPVPGRGGSITLSGKSNDQDNSYTLTWSASTGVVDRYELRRWKAPQGSSGDGAYREDTTIDTGTGRSRRETGMLSSRYKYSVRACNISGCGEFGTETEEVRVFLPRPTPTVANKDNNQDKSYTLKWPPIGGVVTRYELQRWKAPLNTTGDNGYVDQHVVYRGSASSKTETNMPLGRYKYRLRACDPVRCEEQGREVPVLVYPPVPPRGAKPYVNNSDQSSVYDGTYWVRWNVSSGTVDRYELEMQTSLSGPWVRIYKGTTRYHYQDVDVGSRRYRVQACNISGCGGFGDPSEPIVVEGPPDPGAQPYVNASDLSDSYDGTYVVRWGASPSTVNRYELEMQISLSGPWVSIYEGTGRSYSQNVGVGSRRYRVRACNGTVCGEYGTPSSVVRVKPPRVATGTVVTLNSSISRNSQTNAGQLTYSWQQLCGPSVTLTNANTARPTFTATTASANGTGLTRGRIPYLPSGVASFPVYTTFTFRLTVTDAGGGQKTDRVAVTATPNATLASPDAADTLKDKCVTPRLANEIQGTALDERKWLRSWIHENYLWYDEVVDHNPARHDNADTYFGLMKTFAEATSCGQPKDEFHYYYPAPAATSSSPVLTEGSEAGIGVVFGRTSSSRIYADFVHANSPAASVALTNSAGESVATGLVRGDQVTEVDGRRVDSSSLYQVLGVLSEFSTGETRVLKIVRAGITGTLTASITTAVYRVDTVPMHKVVNVDTGGGNMENVGYLLFYEHISLAEQELSEAIQSFNNGQGITDLVLDLRYNRGGILLISNMLATMIANPSATTGRTYERYVYNDTRTFDNDPTNQTDILFRPTRFFLSTYNVTPTTNLPNLNLDRVFVLTSGGTCSASESIINGLLGVDIEVIQIGTTTCGKPYGFRNIYNCGAAYQAVEFIGVNAKGFGDYQHGFAPRIGSDGMGLHEDTVILPGCWVNGTRPRNDLGNETEPLLAAALAYRSSDGTSCTASTSRVSRSRSPTETRETYEVVLREFPPWGGKIIE